MSDQFLGFLLAASLIPMVSGVASFAQGATTPEMISDPSASYPVWLSARAAEQRSLSDSTSFHAVAAERILHLLSQTPVKGCYEAGPIVLDFDGGRPRPRSLEEAAGAYPIFGYGVVRELTPGFQVGEADTSPVSR